MKAILTAAIAVAFAMPAFAQTQCGPRAEVLQALEEKYGETRQVYGITTGGTALTEVFANTETGTWSILVTMPGGDSCLVADGGSFSRVDGAPTPTGDPA